MIAEFKKYRKGKKDYFRSILYSIILVVLIIGVIGFLIISNWRISHKRTELKSKIEDLQKEIEVLESRKAQLEAGIYQTNQEEYWEEKIREQGYKKPGEEAVVIKKETEESEIEELEEVSLWERILEKLKGE